METEKRRSRSTTPGGLERRFSTERNAGEVVGGDLCLLRRKRGMEEVEQDRWGKIREREKRGEREGGRGEDEVEEQNEGRKKERKEAMRDRRGT